MTVERIGIAGAGTMGAGIAQLACLGGFETILHDPQPEALGRGLERVRADLERGAERGRWPAEQAEAAATRLRDVDALEGVGECELVIEAAPEQLELKRELFARLEQACSAEAVLATNTSSLPVSAIAAQAELPRRICGMHFFNPPALMELVEIVAGERTGEEAIETASAVAGRMGRTPVRCKDSPGFIVNRCNRPFTLESLAILGEGEVDHATIDRVIREDGGYRLGPFALMDLIGIDVNLAVARSFYEQRPIARWRPHPIQERMVAEGRLGRKSGRGFYDYEEGRPVEPEREPDPEPELRRRILERVVSQLVNEACFAVAEGVAAQGDIDSAMRLGLNHPRGPFEWLAELGPPRVLTTLDKLAKEHGPERYEAAPGLREQV